MAEAAVGFQDLPNIEWTSLQVAFDFVETGVVVDYAHTTIGEMMNHDASGAPGRYPGFLWSHQRDGHRVLADPAMRPFHQLFLRAARDGFVFLNGVPSGAPASNRQNIPADYFNQSREIDSRYSSLRTYVTRVTDWIEVAVNTRSLKRWIEHALPDLAKAILDAKGLDYCDTTLPLEQHLRTLIDLPFPESGTVALHKAVSWICRVSLQTDGPVIDRFERAATNLRDALAATKLQAFGRKSEQSGDEPIDPVRFRNVLVHVGYEAPFEWKCGERGPWFDVLKDDLQLGRVNGVYAQIEAINVDAEAVRRLWPDGDRSGGQSFRERDEPLILEMRRLMTSGEEQSVINAARRVEPKAAKLASQAGAVERLRKAYGVRYPTRPRR